MTLIDDIQDRIYAINGTISGVNAKRFFPGIPNTSALPIIYSLPGHWTRAQNSGMGFTHGTRVYTLTLVCFQWVMGIPIDSAQTKCEALIDTIIDTYDDLRRLELAGAELNNVVTAQMNSDSGIVPWRVDVSFAAVEFPLTVTTRKAN